MSKNTLSDLNNHLFAQIERLGDESLTAEELHKEIERTKAISEIAKNIVSNANLVLQAEKFKYNNLPSSERNRIPEQFRIKE